MLQYISLLQSANLCIYADATISAVTPYDSQMSDRDASDSKKQLSKSGAPSADLEQENLDLKREVSFSRLHAMYVVPFIWCFTCPCDMRLQIEYLREELRKVKAELSECVFFKEQAEAQLK